ncbi:MAG: aldo/keto reductase [Oscillospiraceae bacterium]|nr:aldo/keto reductase [Oscillospiraceae bacterium]
MKNFGFGCMRLPMIGEEVDIEQFKKMTDRFMEEGFTYFDTAHPYIKGKSETAIKEALTSRYPRESYVLADKLSGSFFTKEEEIRPLFEEELAACGVEYFDYFLMHAQSRNNYPKYCECKAYEIGEELKNEGKIKHLGMSFHDSAEYLEKILIEKPMVEFVQLQFNYADYEDDDVQAKKCLEVCRKYGKPVIVMEPVRGGSLVALPEEAKEMLEATGKSCAEYAVRYAASFEGIFMVLSGMSSIEQLEENIAFMKDFKPLNEEEFALLDKVVEIINKIETIPCTNCKYCTEVCPKNIAIPGIFNVMNEIRRYDKEHTWIPNYGERAASNCIKCGKCEKACPQHIEIRKHLEEAAKVIE